MGVRRSRTQKGKGGTAVRKRYLAYVPKFETPVRAISAQKRMLDRLELAKLGALPCDIHDHKAAVQHVQDGKPLTEIGARLLGLAWDGSNSQCAANPAAIPPVRTTPVAQGVSPVQGETTDH